LRAVQTIETPKGRRNLRKKPASAAKTLVSTLLINGWLISFSAWLERPSAFSSFLPIQIGTNMALLA
jgi:hypothetical protein